MHKKIGQAYMFFCTDDFMATIWQGALELDSFDLKWVDTQYILDI